MLKISFALLLVFIILVYPIFLDRTPIHLNQDELGFALNAYSISNTGFDENGRFYPLYFWHLGVMWSTPIIVYLTALSLQLFPISEIAIRLPSVFIGLINIGLIYILAKRLFKSQLWGLAAGILLATTPVHFIHSRVLLDVQYVVPFVIGWLICLFKFWDSRRPFFLFLSGVILGFGFYSYHAARVMMPFYFFLSAIFLFPEIRKRRALFVIFLAGFILPLIPLIPWTREYPDTLFLDQVRYVGIYDQKASFFQGIFALLSPESLLKRLDVFVSYFNPIFLFLLGDRSLIHSTSLHHPLGIAQSAIRAGVFLIPFAVFIPLGIYVCLKNKSRVNTLIVLGFFTAPLAATIAGDHYRISRALVILPFAMILAVYGIQTMIRGRLRIYRIACGLLIVFAFLQFSYFLFDYWTDYRIRSYAWMKYNIPGALEEVITSTEVKEPDIIYIDRRIEFVDRYWSFYLFKHKREDLTSKTVFFEPKDVVLEDFRENSIVLFSQHDVDGLKSEVGPFKKTANIFEPDGVSVFYVYRN